MTDRIFARCPHCGMRLLVRFGTDGNGGLTEAVDPCGRCAGLIPPAPEPPMEPEDELCPRTAVCVECGETFPCAAVGLLPERCPEHSREYRRRQMKRRQRRQTA